MDRTLALLQNADPADPAPDSAELLQLEGINLNAGGNPVTPSVTTAASLLFSHCVLSFPSPSVGIWLNRHVRTDEPFD